MNPLDFDKKRGLSRSDYVNFEFDLILNEIADEALKDEVARVIGCFWLLYECHKYEEVQEEFPKYNRKEHKIKPLGYQTVRKYAKNATNKILKYIEQHPEFKYKLKKAVDDEINKFSSKSSN
jgi:hypothetical protein